MTLLQEREIERRLDVCLKNFRAGWGKHELHDNLVQILESIDLIAADNERVWHPRFGAERRRDIKEKVAFK